MVCIVFYTLLAAHVCLAPWYPVISHGVLIYALLRHYIPAKTLTNLAIHVTTTCSDKLHTQPDDTHTHLLLPTHRITNADNLLERAYPDGRVVCGIASCLSPLPGFKSRRVCEKVASDLGLGGGFRRVLRFPLPMKTGWTQLSHNIAENMS